MGPWGYLASTSRDIGVCKLATLRHFDSKVPCEVKIRPLIPCERRLGETEISENQEVTSESRFEKQGL